MLRSPRQKYLKQKNEQTVHLSAKRKDTSGVENWAQLEIRQLAITKFHDGTTAKMLLPLSASLLARFFLLPFFFLLDVSSHGLGVDSTVHGCEKQEELISVLEGTGQSDRLRED